MCFLQFATLQEFQRILHETHGFNSTVRSNVSVWTDHKVSSCKHERVHTDDELTKIKGVSFSVKSSKPIIVFQEVLSFIFVRTKIPRDR